MQYSADQVTTMLLIRPVAGKEQVVLEALQKYSKTVEASDPNCLSWRIIEFLEPGEDGGKEFAVIERYTDQASFDAHFEAPYFAEMKQTAPNLRSPVKNRRTTPAGGFMARA